MTKGQVVIYACGGAGINVCSQLETHRGKEEPGYAVIDINYLDTSRSNLKPNLPSESTYILDDLDGSGKLRSQNHVEISNHVRHILQQHKPGDLNIVVSSASGGSGSVISPLLAAELLAQDKVVVVFSIGSTESRQDIDNTIKTIKSFAAVSKQSKRPVPMVYMENSRETPRKQVDASICTSILGFVLLFSRENEGLDTMDLYNWANYHRVTSTPVGLVSVVMFDAYVIKEKATRAISPITMATLVASDEQDTDIGVMPEYKTTGILPAEVGTATLSGAPYYFAICTGAIEEVVSCLNDLLREFERNAQSRVNRGSILGDDDISETGLVL